jgi:hypothetical protein
LLRLAAPVGVDNFELQSVFAEDVGLLANFGHAAFADAASPNGNRERVLRPRVGWNDTQERDPRSDFRPISHRSAAVAPTCEIAHIDGIASDRPHASESAKVLDH